MTVDPSSGIVVWPPTADQQTPQTILLQVTDGQGGVDVQPYYIFVRPEFEAPSITSAPPRIATVDEPYTYPVEVSDPDDESFNFTLTAAPPLMSIHPTDGLVTWTPTDGDLGTNIVQIRVTDGAGLAAFQTYAVHVRPTNTPPEFTSDAETQALAGAWYSYDVDATDAEDAVTFGLIDSPPGMAIDSHTGLVTWKTEPADLGSHPVTVRATDERGAFTDQPYTLEVGPDTEPPSVSVSLDQLVVEPGQPVSVHVIASDNVAVDAIGLEMDGTPVVLDANNGFVFTPASPGLPEFEGFATDTSGNVGTGTATLRVLDPADTDPPFVEITSPEYGATVTYLTEIVGTVTDPNLEFYRLQVSPVGMDQWSTFDEGTSEVVDDVLGTFDPTMLANDIYDVRVMAQDVSGNIWYEPYQLQVAGNAKLGNFRLEFVDLDIPLAGIPIQILRTYDTLEAGHVGDFGFGWQLGLRNARIRESVRASEAEQAGAASLFAANPFRTGTRVYLTNPDGRRVGFTFDPIPEPGFLGTVWHPHFTPDPGVYDQLQVEDVALSQSEEGTFGLYLTGFPYNPSEYTLVTKEQIRYRYDQFTGLLQATDRNDVTLWFTDDGIFSSVGQSITWTRDDQGRITEITDPDGNPIQYAYDAAGDLIAVTNQTDDEYAFTYRTDPPHYLDTSTCPLGLCVARTEYDDEGRVVSITDALGNPITQSYDVANNTEVVADRLGNETTLVYDDRGNVLSVTDAVGHTSSFTYDDNDNPLTITDPRVHTSGHTYDERGNVTGITDALGQETTITYNGLNDPLTITDVLGRTSRFVYDERGNPVEFVNAADGRSLLGWDEYGRPTSHTDLNGYTTVFVYESDLARPTEIVHPDGATRRIAYSALGIPTEVTDERGNVTVYSYDASGQVTAIEDASGAVATFSYVGNRLDRITDPLGRVRRFEYDDGGRKVRDIDATGQITYFAYDANNQLISVTDPEGRTTSYVYRADGLLEREVDAAAFATRYEYDGAGNVTVMVDALGRSTSYAYDELNRLVQRTDAAGGVFQWAYDGKGNLTQTTDEEGRTTTFEYDDLDRQVLARLS